MKRTSRGKGCVWAKLQNASSGNWYRSHITYPPKCPNRVPAIRYPEVSRIFRRRKGSHIRLHELITDRQIICLCTSGYVGKKGELWYVRVVPPLDPELGDFWVTMTTPYVLINFSKSDWMAFLNRTMLHCRASTDEARLHKLLKHGLDTHYWNEFVFKAYHDHRPDAVFLTGIPDMEATLPHA